MRILNHVKTRWRAYLLLPLGVELALGLVMVLTVGPGGSAAIVVLTSAIHVPAVLMAWFSISHFSDQFTRASNRQALNPPMRSPAIRKFLENETPPASRGRRESASAAAAESWLARYDRGCGDLPPGMSVDITRARLLG